MATRTPRRPPGPANQSRAAGAPTPASAAATAPRSGPFYDADDGSTPAPASPLAAVPSDAPLRTQGSFNRTVRESAVALEAGGSADVDVLEREAAAEELVDGETLEEAIARIREFRRPLGAYSQKLALEPRRGYHTHWFNDVAGRIDEAQANGWAHVKGKDSKPIARCVGTGRDKGAMYAFAMILPEQFWLEDMAAKHQAAQSKIDALKASPFRAPSGAAQASDKGKFYDPSEGDAGSGPLVVEKG